MKFLLVAMIMTMLNTVILLQSDSTTNSTAEIILAIGSVIGIIGGIASPFLLIYFNKKMNAVATSIDGLLEQKSKADKALGVVEGIETAQKEKAIGDARELKMRRDQDLINQPPANRDSEIKDVKNQIVETLETQIHRKGEEMKKVVENKSDQIKDEVKEVPTRTADEVVDKLKPPK